MVSWERSSETKGEMRGGEKKQDRARIVREVHRLHTPVQEAIKMHTGMKKVVLNHFSLYPTMVLLNWVEISPWELLQLLTTFSTAPSSCGWWRVCCVYKFFTSHSSSQLHKENDKYAKMRNGCVMTKAQARVDHVLTEKIGAIWPASTRWRFNCSLLITFSWCSAARGSIPRSLCSFCSMSTALRWTVLGLQHQFPHSHPCCAYFFALYKLFLGGCPRQLWDDLFPWWCV